MTKKQLIEMIKEEISAVLQEKAVSKKQQRFMGMVRAVQKGDMKAPSTDIAKTAKSMKKKDAKDFASTKHKGLPEKKPEKKKLYESAGPTIGQTLSMIDMLRKNEENINIGKKASEFVKNNGLDAAAALLAPVDGGVSWAATEGLKGLYKAVMGNLKERPIDNIEDYPILAHFNVSPHLIDVIEDDYVDKIDEEYQQYLELQDVDKSMIEVDSLDTYFRKWVAKKTDGNVIIMINSEEKKK